MIRPEDINGPICGCNECRLAGVETERTRRDPTTGRMMHGHALRAWMDAFDGFKKAARAAAGPKRARGAGGFQRLAVKPEREPGSDDE